MSGCVCVYICVCVLASPPTAVAVLHPGEGDSSQVTLAEAQQEGAGLAVLQQSALHLFAHEAHDEAADRKSPSSLLLLPPGFYCRNYCSSCEAAARFALRHFSVRPEQ